MLYMPPNKAYHIFVIENRDALEERALSDKCGSYLTEHVAILRPWVGLSMLNFGGWSCYSFWRWKAYLFFIIR